MSYLFLLCTILFESIGVALLNKSNGLSHWQYLISGLFFFNAGMIFFSMALKTMDMTIANTTWAGASILIVAMIGYFMFEERYQLSQYLYIGLVLIGLIGLNASGVSK
jgi:small multidrug resistance pump